MAKPNTARPAEAEGAPAKKKKKSPVPISTLIMVVIALPIGYWLFNSYKKWATGRATDAKFAANMDALNKRNAALSNVYDAVLLRRYEVCNKSADQITINWLAAAYHDGKTVKIFNSDHCQDWHPIVMAAGDNKTVLLRSSQPGCNWDGTVFYYAMKYTQESEEKLNIFNVVGPYQGFDRDCYTFK